MSAFRILLVDDDEIMRHVLSQILEHHGFAVTTAGSVSEALEHISSETYDVLLSDLHLPKAGDGLTVVSAMRRTTPAAVTLLLSASPQTESRSGSVDQADEILLKPMEIDDLLNVINQRIAKGPWRRTIDLPGSGA